MQYAVAMATLRERKRVRTRQAIIDAATELFAEHGYDGTTIADIAAAADIGTRTFFSYFASKEDVVLHDAPERMREVLARVRDRRPGEPVADLLIRVAGGSLDSATAEEGFDGVEEAQARLGLIMTVPALQARALQTLFDNQLRLARALGRQLVQHRNRFGVFLLGNQAACVPERLRIDLARGFAEFARIGRRVGLRQRDRRRQCGDQQHEECE